MKHSIMHYTKHHSALLIALMSTTIYAIFTSKDIIHLECPATYLNPWQYFFDCTLWHGLHYALVFTASFTLVYLAMRMTKHSNTR